MLTLDPPYTAVDRSGMAARIEAIPADIETALAALAAAPWEPPRHDPSLLAVGAMGGSAMAADLCAALWADRLPRPMLVVRGYRWPACVSREGLALVCSYSGGTEETLALYAEAGTRAVPRLALTTGGALGEACARDGVQALRLPGGSPPRAALFSAWVPVSGLLHALGWIDDPGPAWREAAAVLREQHARIGPRVPEAHNPCKQLARSLQGRLAFVYAGSERVGPVATRWRNQLNENAKLLAHSALVPELNHNEIVGWETAGAAHAPTAGILLRDPEDAPEVALRLGLTGEWLARQGAAVHPVHAPAAGRLARAAALVQYGDWLSLYLALLGGVDPTPIASIDAFKLRLAEHRTEHGR
jgi:glucose/mannose-6-phosphate isomerase